MPLFLLIITLLLPGVTLAECIAPQAQADRLAADYQLIRQHGANRTEAPLQFVRLQDKVLRIRPDRHIAELWQRSDDGGNDFYRYFLEEERTVYYPVSDLLTLNIHRNWQSVNSLFDEQALALLQTQGEVTAFCLTARRYHGRVQDKEIELLWLADLRLPAYLKITGQDGSQEMRLQGFAPIDTVRQQLRRWQSFPSIDYADVGDSESDPFIARMIRQGFIEHGASGMYDSDGHPIGGHGH